MTFCGPSTLVMNFCGPSTLVMTFCGPSTLVMTSSLSDRAVLRLDGSNCIRAVLRNIGNLFCNFIRSRDLVSRLILRVRRFSLNCSSS